MFQSAALRLTLWYLALAMLLALFFSIVLYRVSTLELDRNLKRQELLLHELPEGVGSRFLERRIGQLEESKHHLLVTLGQFNVIILALSGLMSYLLAKRTLLPIQAALDREKQFTADASHELRTPLAAMKTELEVALRDKRLTLAESKKLHASTLEEIERMADLVDSLLKLARHEHSQLAFQRLAIADLAREALERVRKQAESRQITLHEQLSDATILGDRQSLVELFVILLDNAIKYSSEGKQIWFAIKHRGQQITIEVRDEGPGIHPDDVPYIFDRFYRADPSRNHTKTSGFGLGLAIAKQIVTLHAGQITVQSELGKGTRFTILLPRSR